MTLFLTHALEIFGVVFLRFRPLPRLWGLWLVSINLGCLLFITHVEAQAVLATTVVAVAAQTFIYQRIGFTRILGATHILWLPMFAWMATRLDAIISAPGLAHWLTLLFVTNMVSATIDVVDTVRFLRGERLPHYSWALSNEV